MPSFETTPIELDDGLVIGRYQHKQHKKPYWYARMLWQGKRQYAFKSTKVEYEESEASKRLASRAARKLFKDFNRKADAGLNPKAENTISSVAEEYFKHISDLAKKNDSRIKRGLNPLYEVDGGRGFYSSEKCESIRTILFGESVNSKRINKKKPAKFLNSFWRTLKTEEIANIDPRELDKFNDWAIKHNSWSPNRRLRVITEIRHIFRYAYSKGYVNSIPSPKRPRENLKGRARRNLTYEEWKLILDFARKNYEQYQPTNGASKYLKDSALQFWAWLNLISWSGIRPPSGKPKKNLFRWDDIRVEGKKRTMVRNDKTKYEAVIMPEAYPFLDFLRDFQIKRDLKDCEFMFAHTRDRDGSFKKGDPILTFRNAWEVALKETGLWEDWGTSANQKLVPYSLRGFYITMRIRKGDVPLITLANNLGSSVRMLEQSYYAFDAMEDFDTLVANSGIANLAKVKYDDDGYPIIKT